MVTYGLNYDVRPGREEEFEERFRAVLDAVAAFPGHRSSRLYRDVLSPSSYLVYSEWDTREDFQAFLHSEAFAATTSWGREEILASRPRHFVFAGPERV